MACGDSYSIWLHDISDIIPPCHGGKPGSTPGGVVEDLPIVLLLKDWGDLAEIQKELRIWRMLAYSLGNMGWKVTGELLPRMATFDEQIDSLFYLASLMERICGYELQDKGSIPL